MLSRGLGFTPSTTNSQDTNAEEIEAMRQPINNLIKKMLRAEGKTPTTTNFTFTDQFINNITTAHINIQQTTNNITNLTEHEQRALRDLKRDYIIKPVDKGLGVAVIDRQCYIELAERDHLHDANTYKELDHDPSQEISSRINTKLAILHNNNLITDKQAKKLQVAKDSTLGRFYILPKLHKKKLGTRPIVSNVQHPTKAISQYMHDQLLPTAKRAKSYLENSLELTKLLKEIKPTNNTFFITADITSLYTNIPNEEGAEQVAETTANDESNPHHIRNKYKVRELLKLVLENNGFEFNGKHYLQVNGTAMGTIMAPTYANIFLRGKEEGKLFTNPLHQNAQLYKRYIDDILVVYDNQHNDISNYIKAMREAFAPLELTVHVGRERTPFLDLELEIVSNTIQHTIYKKPHSNQEYIPATSLHPQHIKESIIYNDLLRTHRLTTDPAKAKAYEISVLHRALKAGYSSSTVNKLIHKARTNATADKQPKEQDEFCATLKLTHNGETTSQLQRAIRDEWRTLASEKANIRICNKTNKNIQQHLVCSKIQTTTKRRQQTTNNN